MVEIFNPNREDTNSVVVGVRNNPTFCFALEQRGVDGWQLDFLSRGGIAFFIDDLAVAIVPIEPVDKDTRLKYQEVIVNLLKRGHTGWFNRDNAVSLRFSHRELIGVRRQSGGGGDRDMAYLRFANQTALRTTFLALLPESEVSGDHKFFRFQRLGRILTALGMNTDENLSQLREMLPNDHWIKGGALSSRP